VKIKFDQTVDNTSYQYITDDTNDIDKDTLFLKTAQNSKYFDDTHPYITPDKLLKLWELDSMKVVGITGTNGKTTVTAGIYSLMLDLGYKVALQGTRGVFANERYQGATCCRILFKIRC